MIESPIFIPEQFYNIPYRADCYPGAPNLGKLKDGANCQSYAYALIRHYGRVIPDFRSSELWIDEKHTCKVEEPLLLDLVLIHDNKEAWGAHISVYLGQDLILHLSKSIGIPAVETLEDLIKRPQYCYLIGFKRCLIENNTNN